MMERWERWLNRVNPLNYFSLEGYAASWQSLFSTLLQGFWGRLLALSFLVLSFWFGVRRRNFAVALAFFVLALLVTYGAPLLKILGLL
jgi:hypothetical protein